MTFQESPGLEISMSYIYAVIPVSTTLMLLYLIGTPSGSFRAKKSSTKILTIFPWFITVLPNLLK